MVTILEKMVQFCMWFNLFRYMLSKQNGFCYKVECLSPILLVLHQLNGNQEICIKIQYLVRILLYDYELLGI